MVLTAARISSTSVRACASGSSRQSRISPAACIMMLRGLFTSWATPSATRPRLRQRAASARRAASCRAAARSCALRHSSRTCSIFTGLESQFIAPRRMACTALPISAVPESMTTSVCACRSRKSLSRATPSMPGRPTSRNTSSAGQICRTDKASRASPAMRASMPRRLRRWASDPAKADSSSTTSTRTAFPFLHCSPLDGVRSIYHLKYSRMAGKSLPAHISWQGCS